MTPKSILSFVLLTLTASNSFATDAANTAETRTPSNAAQVSPAQPAPGPGASGHADVTRNKPQTSGDHASAIPPTDLISTKAREEANRKHIRPPTAPVVVDTPPPAPRQEKRPVMTAPGLVWVPGHWVPTKTEWQWVSGEWGVPATPISVWIEPKYDAKTKQWRPGYWQPDREESYEEEPSQEDRTPTPKFL
jgi:hypothetical protein